MRDSEKTRKKIMEAVGRVLAQKGFGHLGINAVAREAGVDKVLIYRYFGGLPELLRAYAGQGGFWPSIAELAGKPLNQFKSILEMGTALLSGHMRELLARPLTQEIMRWELHERNELTDELARYREQQGGEIMALFPKDDDGTGVDNVDRAAAAALIHAGITYLVLRQKTADVYMGIDLTSEDGWLRLGRAVSHLMTNLFGEKE